MKLSIIIPVYNEEKTILEILKRLINIRIPSVEKEVIVVDDGSSDRTVANIKYHPSADGLNIKNIKLIKHYTNRGKGSAVRTGIKNATGDYILIQDADLEYNPKDIPRLIAPVLNGNAEVVYGTRLRRLPNFSRDERNIRFFLHYIGNRLLSLITSILYGQWITDMETCYKIFPRNVLEKIDLSAKGFEFEAEITAKLLKKGVRIKEVPITTNPRGYNEGKKLRTFRDGAIALFSLLKYRFID